MPKRKSLVLDKEEQNLIDELKRANKLFFMALARRKRAKEALKLHQQSRLKPEPVLQLDLFGYAKSASGYPF